MLPYYAEFFETMLLIILGDGACANVYLSKTKGNNSGWIVICFGWAFAVGIPAYIFGTASGASFNPELTITLAAVGKLSWAVVPGYCLAEVLGGIAGGVMVWLIYFPHWAVTEDKAMKLGVFCTACPIAGKGGSDWGYAWIPIVASICGGVLGALATVALFG